MGYRDYPITTTHELLRNARYALEQTLEAFENRAGDDECDGVTMHFNHVVDTAERALVGLTKAIEAERDGLRCAHEKEAIAWRRSALARQDALPAEKNLSGAEAWLIRDALQGQAEGVNMLLVEPAGPVRLIADRLVEGGFLARGKAEPESPTEMTWFHATPAGAQAISQVYWPPGTPRPHTHQARQTRERIRRIVK